MSPYWQQSSFTSEQELKVYQKCISRLKIDDKVIAYISEINNNLFSPRPTSISETYEVIGREKISNNSLDKVYYNAEYRFLIGSRVKTGSLYSFSNLTESCVKKADFSISIKYTRNSYFVFWLIPHQIRLKKIIRNEKV